MRTASLLKPTSSLRDSCERIISFLYDAPAPCYLTNTRKTTQYADSL